THADSRFDDTLGGWYITAEDVGTTQADMDVIRRETSHVTGVSRWLGGSGDPSAATAYGVFHAMKAAALACTGSNELAERHIVVAGVGKVGTNLVRHLVEELAGYHRERAYARIRRIYDTTLTLIQGAGAEGISTTAYAERMAEQRIDDIGRLVHITTFQ